MERLLFAGLAIGVSACALVQPKTYDGVDLAPGDLHAKDLSVLTNVREVSGEPIVIVKDGVARLVIVHADTDANKWAAQQLQTTIREMTGIAPKIVRERKDQAVSNIPAFYIGETAAAKKAGLAAPTDHPEAYRVVAKDGSFYFLGKADFAVTDWCERQLDARYYWPMRPCDMPKSAGTNLVYGKCVVKTHGLAARPVDWDDRPVYPEIRLPVTMRVAA